MLGLPCVLRVFAMMISRATPEGVVNAPSKESGWPTTGQAITDAAIARLTETLRALSKEAGENADAFLAKVTMVADQHISGAQHAGIALVEHGNKLRSHSATDIRPLILDGIQQRCRCGPSLALDDNHPACRVDDFSAETRWPTFVGPVLACSPIRSMLSFRYSAIRGSAACSTSTPPGPMPSPPTQPVSARC